MVNVYIDGDKTGFKSKVGVDKLKALVRTTVSNKEKLDVSALKEKYILDGYDLELKEQTEIDIKFTVNKSAPVQSSRDILKAKLKMMRNGRTNHEVHAAKTNKDIPEDILAEYLKLKKITPTPIPEPGEILKNPEQYKPVIQMVLGNKMMKQYGASHPYVRYFTLLAEKLGVEPLLPVPTQDYGELLQKKIDTVEMKGKEVMNADYETDSETDSEKE